MFVNHKWLGLRQRYRLLLTWALLIAGMSTAPALYAIGDLLFEAFELDGVTPIKDQPSGWLFTLLFCLGGIAWVCANWLLALAVVATTSLLTGRLSRREALRLLRSRYPSGWYDDAAPEDLR